MKAKSATVQATRTPARRAGQIHPVIIYPIKQPADNTDLDKLYQLAAQLQGEGRRYARPITVMDRKTARSMEGNKAFIEFRNDVVSKHSELMEAWCVDTCQMWYTGLGAAFDRGQPDDVYWLIPGDFNYGTPLGQEVLARLHDLPDIISELGEDLCVGEITAEYSHSKQLIDTYGTFALLYNWFPAQAREIRKFTERPRSEFFAIGHAFLQEVLGERWYTYEQTMVMLVKAAGANKRMSRFHVGEISDLPQGRDTFASAVQQVERIERVLKTMWCERHQSRDGWAQEFSALENLSDKIRGCALSVLQTLL